MAQWNKPAGGLVAAHSKRLIHQPRRTAWTHFQVPRRGPIAPRIGNLGQGDVFLGSRRQAPPRLRQAHRMTSNDMVCNMWPHAPRAARRPLRPRRQVRMPVARRACRCTPHTPPACCRPCSAQASCIAVVICQGFQFAFAVDSAPAALYPPEGCWLCRQSLVVHRRADDVSWEVSKDVWPELDMHGDLHSERKRRRACGAPPHLEPRPPAKLM